MATMTLPTSEWTVRTLRPVAHWVTERAANGTTRLVMVWSVPDPTAESAALVDAG
jgi:hypothetical protein